MKTLEVYTISGSENHGSVYYVRIRKRTLSRRRKCVMPVGEIVDEVINGVETPRPSSNLFVINQKPDWQETRICMQQVSRSANEPSDDLFFNEFEFSDEDPLQQGRGLG